VGSYKEPLGGHPVFISILPINAVEPTPFQRDLSDAHHKRLADVINKTGRFLDPIIAVVAPREGFWTPNGRHRLEAMRRLGAKSITALVVSDREVAWQILALNTEKAHNLKERALEVIRIYRGLVDEDGSLLFNPFFACNMPSLGLTSSTAISATLSECFLNQFVAGANLPDQAFGPPNPLKELLLDSERQHSPIERICAKLGYLSKKIEKPFFLASKHQICGPRRKRKRALWVIMSFIIHDPDSLSAVRPNAA
jgi:hypothetical protein